MQNNYTYEKNHTKYKTFDAVLSKFYSSKNPEKVTGLIKNKSTIVFNIVSLCNRPLVVSISSVYCFFHSLL